MKIHAYESLQNVVCDSMLKISMRSQDRASSLWTYDKNENNKQEEDYFDRFNIEKKDNSKWQRKKKDIYDYS